MFFLPLPKQKVKVSVEHNIMFEHFEVKVGNEITLRKRMIVKPMLRVTSSGRLRVRLSSRLRFSVRFSVKMTMSTTYAHAMVK